MRASSSRWTYRLRQGALLFGSGARRAHERAQTSLPHVRETCCLKSKASPAPEKRRGGSFLPWMVHASVKPVLNKL